MMENKEEIQSFYEPPPRGWGLSGIEIAIAKELNCAIILRFTSPLTGKTLKFEQN
jgi:hypothetical protein